MNAPAPRGATVTPRGGPVWLLVAVFVGWIGLRGATWTSTPSVGEPAAAMTARAGPAPRPVLASAEASPAALPADVRGGLSPEVADQFARELPRELAHQLAVETAREMARAMAPALARRMLRERGLGRLVQAEAGAAVPRSGRAARRLALAHPPTRATGGEPVVDSDVQAFRLTPGPSAAAAAPQAPAGQAAPAPPHRSLLAMLPEMLLHPGRVRQSGLAIEPSSRFSADAWVLMRSGMGGNAPLVAGTAGYGGSQSGAVLRYRLFANDQRQAAVFLRAASALALPQREATVGLQLRPLPKVPVVLLGEARLTNDGTGNRLRPAVQAVSQFAPVSLPLGLRGELYAAGGYVGGRGATPFYDVAGVADRKLLMLAPGAELRVGAGAWAGGQRGVGRVDVGPRASVGFHVKRIGLRAAVDYRARVSGNAAPGSGPALTLSAGF